MTDYTRIYDDIRREAEEAAKAIPQPSATVLRFPATPAERLERQGRAWMRKWTRPMPEPPTGGLVA